MVIQVEIFLFAHIHLVITEILFDQKQQWLFAQMMFIDKHSTFFLLLHSMSCFRDSYFDLSRRLSHTVYIAHSNFLSQKIHFPSFSSCTCSHILFSYLN